MGPFPKLCVAGGLIILSGLAIVMFDISAIGGIILILVGALVVAVSILFNPSRGNYSAIPTVSATLPQATSPSSPVDQRPPTWCSPSPAGNGHMAYDNQTHSASALRAVSLHAAGTTQPFGYGPSAPTFNYEAHDNPPSYDELFSNK